MSAQRFDTLVFAPKLGAYEGRLLKLVMEVSKYGAPADLVAERAAGADRELADDAAHSEQRTRWALALSILSDISAAGAAISVIDSQLTIEWPDWTSAVGQAGLRNALSLLRDESKQIRVSSETVEVMPPSMTGTQVLRLLQCGEVRLHEGWEIHPSGVSYAQIYNAARSYWTMPNRDREGRNRRFVLTVSECRGSVPYPVGIIEVGDGPPNDPARDAALGLDPIGFAEWFSCASLDELILLRTRLFGLLKALKPIPGFSSEDLPNIYEHLSEIEAGAAGRSGGNSDLQVQKRRVYLARLARAVRAVDAQVSSLSPYPKDISAALRVIRDLVVPRVALEITVCGSIPPFTTALGGKLVTAFCADPRIIEICNTEPGHILRDSFDADALRPLLPSSGTLLLTTKGLYAEHSAQYERAAVPGVQRTVKLRKVGVTSGQTASLISRRSYRLAQQLLALCGSTAVSGDYGSGGSKRQRRIEAAVRELGLPLEIIHPKVRRPAYALSLVSNIRDVCTLNADPQWTVDPDVSPAAYAERARLLWSDRWSAAARRRVRDETNITGMHTWLSDRERND